MDSNFYTGEVNEAHERFIKEFEREKELKEKGYKDWEIR